MKRMILFAAAASALVAATPEQVERYLLLSGSEEQLIQFEQTIDQMSQMLTAKDGQDVPLMQDSQMIPIRFRAYLQRNLSDAEMEAVLANYQHDVLRKLVSAQVLMGEADTREAYRQFLSRIQSDPLPANRTETVKAIIKKIYDEKMLRDFFKKMFLPMVQQMGSTDGKPISDQRIKVITKQFVQRMQEGNRKAMLFMTRDFTDAELDTLNTLSGNSATSHETHAVFGAIVSAMGEAMEHMAKRFGHMVRQHRHPSIPVQHDRNRTAGTEGNISR